MKSISKLKIFLAVMAFLIGGDLFSQDIQLTTIAPPPHPSLLSEFQESSDNYRVNIINQNAFQDYNIIIQGRLTSDNGIEAQLSEDFNDYQIINIPAGSNQIYLFEELGNFFGNLSIDDVDYSGGPEVNYLIQSQRLPDGIYTICLEARDFDSRELLSLPLEANCSNPIVIQSVNPPVITSPLDDEIIEQVQPTMFNISWTPVIAPSSSIVYDLRLAEYNELVNPYDAIEDNNFLQFEETDLRQNIFVYNQAHTPLTPGQKYILRVRARDENNSVNIFNQGWSDIVVFTFGEDIDIVDPNGNELAGGNYECMSPCISIDIPDVPALPSISIGDIFKLGHFRLQIDNFQQTVNGFSGRGVIKASDFIPKDINVSFEDVNINSRNMVTAGVVRGLRKAVAEAFPRVDMIAQNTDLDDHLIDRLYDELLDPAAAMISDDINDALEDLEGALSLPISFGEGVYKIHIPDMTFTAQGANVSMITGYELIGDYMEGSKKLVFGSDNICITPGGLSLSEEILKLNILTPYDFNPSEVFGVHINGSEGDNPSYIDIDCDGINEIVLNGHIAFDRNYIRAISPNGNPIDNKNFATSFHASFTDWDEMIFTASSDIQGAQNDLYFSSLFEARELPEFKFNFENMVIDLSENSNKEDMSFPENYGSPANWTGAFIKNIQLQLPDYFDQGPNNIDLSLEDFLIDDSGVSFKFTGNNLEELSDLSMGGWGVNIGNLSLTMMRNSLQLASLNGEIELPICENPVGLGGQIRKIEDRLDYDLDLDIREKWEIPMWACKFKCNDQSRISAKVEDGEFRIKAILSGELELNDAISNFDNIKIKKIRFEDMEIGNTGPYFSPGHFDIDAVASAEFLGFKVNLEDIEIGEIQRPGIVGKLPQLGFDLGFKFGEKDGAAQGMYLSADSRLLLTGKRNPDTGRFEFDDINLRKIEIDSEVASVKVRGRLDIYDDHQVYGDGIGGAVEARFINQLTISSRVLFGNVSNYDYWYVDAGVILPQGIPLVPPVELKGFSGGAYYNMNQTIDNNAPVGEAAITYVPRKGGWGFRAGGVWALSGTPSMLNGNIDLLVDFGRGGALNSITLAGRAKMMDAPSFNKSDMPNTEMLFQGMITYNHVRRSLSADFGYRLDIPRGIGFIDGGNLNNNNISLNVEGLDNWRINLGIPRTDGKLDDMLNINLNAGCRVKGKFIGLTMGINGYFNLGANIPATPPMPPRAKSVVGNDISLPPRPRFGLGTGIHAAFSTGDVGFDYDIVGIVFNAGAGFGLDASFGNYRGRLCNGDPDFGVNNWYFNARAYLYADASLKGILFGDRYNLASASIGAYLTAAGPNPFYASGRLRVSAKLPLIGRKRFWVGFSMGEKCEFTDDPNQGEEFLDELSETSVLEDLTYLPEGNVRFTDNSVYLDAQFFKRPNVVSTERFGNRVIQYKVEYNIKLKVFENGRWRNHKSKDEIEHLRFASGRTKIFLNRGPNSERLLSPGKDYKLEVTGTLKYANGYNGSFQIAERPNGERLIVRKYFEFSSTALEDYELDILEITPKPSRKNYHVGDAQFQKGHIIVSNETLQMLNELGFREYANLRFTFTEYAKGTHVPTGNSHVSTGIIYPYNARKVAFDIRQLRDGYKYKMEIDLIYEDNDPILMYSQLFSTSKYRTFTEKLNRTYTYWIGDGSNGHNGPTYNITFTGQEDFEMPYEQMSLSYLNHYGRDPSEWSNRRRIIENFARTKGFLNSVKQMNPEFVAVNLNPPNNNGNPFGGINILNLNITPDVEGDPPVLKFNWRPNSYLTALRDYAISNHYKEINNNAELRNAFLFPFMRIPEVDIVGMKLKGVSREEEKNYELRF